MRKKLKISLPLLAITLAAALLRFYNLNWGNGFYFHPDEGNMARAIGNFGCEINPAAISNFQFPILRCALNPHFFAYGQFPLYLAYFSFLGFGALLKIIRLPPALFLDQNAFIPSANNPSFTAPFPAAVFWLRFWSAAAGTLIIPLTYLTTKLLISRLSIRTSLRPPPPNQEPAPNAKKFSEDFFALLAALFAAFTPGLIQAAHFGTTESLLTFFFLLILYLSLKILRKKSADRPLIFTIAITGAISGIAVGTKLTAAYFLAAPILAILIQGLKSKAKTQNSKQIYKSNIQNSRSLKIFNFVRLDLSWILKFEFWISILLGITLLFAILSSPYNLLQFQEFRRISAYETQIAAGATLVFYTRQFIDTAPFLFQAQKIFPYALGWPLFIFGLWGFLSITHTLVANIKKIYQPPVACYLLLIGAFLAYFIPNSLLFAKWTRFMTPILPFFSIFTAYAFHSLFATTKKSALMATFSIIPGLLFFTIYARPDVRIAASRWIYANVPDGSHILSETGNVVDLPIDVQDYHLEPRTYNVIGFDFYHVDENTRLQNELIERLIQADYILVPSRRIFANHARLPNQYPLTTAYYNALFSGTLGFAPIHAQTSFPGLRIADFKLQISDELAEETWSVFDHPVVRVYKKTKQYPKSYYEKILKPENFPAIISD